ncbi:MAG: manganese efflux pump [Bacteroidales bacterium]|nr:manganese efflux pump [Bacteroidales bacterium]
MSPILHDILVGLSLCADCFAVSLCTGMTGKKQNLMPVALTFAIIQTGFLVAGWGVGFAASTLVAEKVLRFEFYARLLGFLLLLYVGGMMLADGLRKKEDRFSVDAFAGILMGAVATSIDAFSVGFSLALNTPDPGLRSILPLAESTFAFTLLSVLVGLPFGHLIGRIYGHIARVVGGLILIGIGVNILL